MESVTEILLYFYRLELLIPASNTMLQLLVILFVINSFARQMVTLLHEKNRIIYALKQI